MSDCHEPVVLCFASGFTTLRFGLGTLHAWHAAGLTPPGHISGVSDGAWLAVAMDEMLALRDPNNTPSDREKTYLRHVITLAERLRGEVAEEIPSQADLFVESRWDKGYFRVDRQPDAPPPTLGGRLPEAFTDPATQDRVRTLDAVLDKARNKRVKLVEAATRVPLRVSDFAKIVLARRVTGFFDLIRRFGPFGTVFAWRHLVGAAARVLAAVPASLQALRVLWPLPASPLWTVLRQIGGMATILLLSLATVFSPVALVVGLARLLGVCASWAPVPACDSYTGGALVAFGALCPFLAAHLAVRAIKRASDRPVGPPDPRVAQLLRELVPADLFLERLALELLRFSDKPSTKPMGTVVSTVRAVQTHGKWALERAPADEPRALALARALLPLATPTADGMVHHIDGGRLSTTPLAPLYEGKGPLSEHTDLTGTSGRLFMIFGLPPGPLPEQSAPTNPLDVGILGWRTNRRLDLDLDLRLLWFRSWLVQNVTPDRPYFEPCAIGPSPEDLRRENGATDRERILALMAAGCRRTLEAVVDDPDTWARVSPGPGFPAVGERRCAAKGLPEVCALCDRRLVPRARTSAPPEGPNPFLPPAERLTEAAKDALTAAGEQTEPKPRITFIASGGVFRGVFQIGILGAFWRLGVKPDVCVAGSVGNLMAALAARLAQPDVTDDSARLLDIARMGLGLDKLVAGTESARRLDLQTAARLMSLEASPRHVRDALLGPCANSPGMVVGGVPGDLIDLVKRLLILPHDAAHTLASAALGSDWARAWELVLAGVRDHTLPALQLHRALIGAERLEVQLRKLLAGSELRAVHLDSAQPFAGQSGHRTAIFGSVTCLNDASMRILGSVQVPDPGTGHYDFVKGILAATAFPGAFEPVSDATVRPGVGRTDLLFADGGIVDNLPLIPAIDMLSALQVAEVRASATRNDPQAALLRLRARVEQPHLMIVSTLSRPDVPGVSGKRDAVRASARRTDELLRTAIYEPESFRATHAPGVASDLDAIVSTGMLFIEPPLPDSMIGTFQINASLGFSTRKVAVSIADGCHTTLTTLLGIRHDACPDAPQASVDVHQRAVGLLSEAVAPLARAEATAPKSAPGMCPHFTLHGRPMRCPFAEGGPSTDEREPWAVHQVCSRRVRRSP